MLPYFAHREAAADFVAFSPVEVAERLANDPQKVLSNVPNPIHRFHGTSHEDIPLRAAVRQFWPDVVAGRTNSMDSVFSVAHAQGFWGASRMDLPLAQHSPHGYRLVISACVKRTEAIAALTAWARKEDTDILWDGAASWNPPENAATLRDAYARAGVHCYVPDAQICANASMVFAHVNEPGRRTVRLPADLRASGTEFRRAGFVWRDNGGITFPAVSARRSAGRKASVFF